MHECFSKTIGFLSRPWMNHRTRMAARGSLKRKMPQMCTDLIPTMKAVVKMFVLDASIGSKSSGLNIGFTDGTTATVLVNTRHQLFLFEFELVPLKALGLQAGSPFPCDAANGDC
jgi:hypothetical protein